MAVILTVIFMVSFVGSFIFAGFETGFISWNALKVEHRAARGGKRSRLAMILENNSAMLITTVLIGNNIALVGMSLSVENLFVDVPLLGSELFQTVFLTVLALIFCELLPKSLFRIYSFRLTMRFVPLVSLFFFLFYPISKVISLMTGGGGAVNSRREAMAAIAMEGGRHKLFSSIYGEVVERVVTSERAKLSTLLKKLTPLEYNETCVNEAHEKIPKFKKTMMLSKFISHKEFLSQERFIVEEAGTFLCYSQQEAFEKLFLF